MNTLEVTKDYMSADGTEAICSDGHQYSVNNVIKSKQSSFPGTIKRFRINHTTHQVIAETEHGWTSLIDITDIL